MNTLSPTINYMQVFSPNYTFIKTNISTGNLKVILFHLMEGKYLEINNNKSKLQTLEIFLFLLNSEFKKKSIYPWWTKTPKNLVWLIVMHKAKETLM